MILPAFFGHKKSINLLPRDSFENSSLGIVLEWALVFGKWAVILTQLIVMGAFLWRFTLDRSLTDLRKSIAKDVAIIKSYEQVERDYVIAQKQVKTAKAALRTQTQILDFFAELAKITPPDVWYEKVSMTPDSINLTAYAGSLPGFGQYLNAIQKSPKFDRVRLGKLETSTTKGASMQFDIAANVEEKK